MCTLVCSYMLNKIYFLEIKRNFITTSIILFFCTTSTYQYSYVKYLRLYCMHERVYHVNIIRLLKAVFFKYFFGYNISY